MQFLGFLEPHMMPSLVSKSRPCTCEREWWLTFSDLAYQSFCHHARDVTKDRQRTPETIVAVSVTSAELSEFRVMLSML